MKPRAWNSTLPARTRPLEARTGLRPGAGLARPAASPLRRTPLRHRSAKTAQIYVTRRQIVAELFACPQVCEVPWCTSTATDPHEPLTRARGGDRSSPLSGDDLALAADRRTRSHIPPVLPVYRMRRKELP